MTLKLLDLVNLPKGINYDSKEDIYFVQSFSNKNKKYDVFRLNKAWIFNCKGF
jgi:hypothetical protein